MCATESSRRYNRSEKVGPPSHYRGDAQAKLDALEQGNKCCSRCGQVKEPEHFSRSAKHPMGLHSWCKACCSEQRRERYKRDRAEINLQRRATQFGVTPEFLRQLVARHDGLCAICRQPCPSRRQLAVDHDHRTGQVRGLLCANCNRGIGLLQDSAAVVEAAANYLRPWEQADA